MAILFISFRFPFCLVHLDSMELTSNLVDVFYLTCRGICILMGIVVGHRDESK